SLADGLKDRVGRQDVHKEGYVATREADEEIVDLLERVLETMELMNLDVLNDRLHVQENRDTAIDKGIPYNEAEHRPFAWRKPEPWHPLPLTARGREWHRRLIIPEVLLDFVRKRPDFVARYVREPLSANPFFDWRMPALMRGAAGHPL